MFAKFTLLAAALQASLVVAGNAVISNRCSYDVWVWSVDQSHSSGPIKIAARTQYSEPLRNTATALKVSKSDQLVAGAHTQFEYSLINNQIWYDISFVNCAKGNSADNCPGHDKGLSMDSSMSSCGKVNCGGGSYCPTQAYYVDQPLLKLGIQEPVFTCPGAGTNMDIAMKVCSGEAPLKRSIAGRMLVDIDA
ncbi:hypothetical protein GQ44DRAFT_742542 [Phaeosphaeriaceae sp. PMI808]|nr:hypothetical protein GQ44DRAFT_742542 [Phaeosphaeriaceae sp. PMI808]